MPEVFLKKINSKKGGTKENPFDKIFQSKKIEIKSSEEPSPVKKDYAPNSLDGIENLGKSHTSEEKHVETQQTTENAVIRENKPEENDNLNLETEPKGLASDEKIPAKTLENANIFASPQQQSNFLPNVKSSTNNLFFEDEGNNDQNVELLILKITDMLRQKKRDEAIKFIMKHF